MQRKLIIGTRGSPLALYQAKLVESLLGCESEIKILKTSGDSIKGDLKEFGGKGLFTKELEDALMEDRIDLAVHSMKDVPTLGQDGLLIGAVLEREDPRDAFMSYKASTLADLPEGAIVGSASIRRRAQLAAMRPDIEFKLLRGNVGTRLEKLKNEDCDATFLACAGLKRLGLEALITQAIDTNLMLPAPAQGAIGIEIRNTDKDAAAAIAPLNHADTDLAITAERAFLRALDGSCRTPIAALAKVLDGGLNFRGEVIAKDGSICFARTERLEVPSKEKAFAMGLRLGEEIRKEAGDRIKWDE
ncbi:hydroxymethylbilane synthase [Hellea balneolensis]|uniref:hydroxymethylbilane synthase n=1 Tax=Hellea balneolensis TaxID=287478 RepID=UPI00041003A0|nr:hydroxymethylbilane synthase [Hellea balneolensis]